MVYHSGPGFVIHLGDSSELLATWSDNKFDLALTDPPYGIGMAANRQVGGSSHRFTRKDWDARRPDSRLFEEVQRISRQQVIWGGNYYADLLPPSRCWLVWHKKPHPNRTSFADIELAWTSLNQNARYYPHLWSGGAKAENEPRYAHPTQKPRAVIRWCLNVPTVRPTTVVDPFMGSGTTVEACLREGVEVVAVDREEEYCEMAARRADAVSAELGTGSI
jgi:site-specific DNA-methyltransferase (adenine-specific)